MPRFDISQTAHVASASEAGKPPWSSLCGSAALDDESFVEGFENCCYPSTEFRHADHVRLTWIYIRRFGALAAEERIATGIRRFASSLGHETKFHVTVTRAWFRLVHSAYRDSPDETDFGRFLELHPSLKNKNSLAQFYSNDLLISEIARQQWVEPDLKPLPG